MTTLLVKHATLLVTMDEHRREIPDGGLFVRDGFLEQVGPTDQLPITADEVLDLSGHIILPGLINTHHHFFQTLTRAYPAAQNVSLGDWLKILYPIWARITPEDIYTAARTALAELAFSGCTTAADHMYIAPNGARLDDEIRAGREIGLRLHAGRGSLSLGESQGGLPPDRLVEKEDFILQDSQRLITTYHDPRPGAFTQVMLAPSTPFSVSADLLRQSAVLARESGVRLHTHLAETRDEDEYCLILHGHRVAEYLEHIGWVGPDVWFAHLVHTQPEEIAFYARRGCGVAHCPSSNMRLASGIAPVWEMLQAGMKVGLGVDGSSCNDSSHLLGEARQALLAARLRAGLQEAVSSSESVGPLMTARQALELATRGGAAVLGRADLGSLEPGKCADFCALDLNRLDYAGALSDPLAAVLFCAPRHVDYTVVGGRIIIHAGELQTADVPRLVEAHNLAARRLLER